MYHVHYAASPAPIPKPALHLACDTKSAILQVWLTDKDRAEKTAIREVFPDCEQFLCSFHVLQSFRRELNLAGVGKAERERILGVLQQLVYANSDDEYSRLRENIRHPATDRYLKDNWDDIRWEWVRGLSGAAMSGVFTNNHLESLHGKMKSVCRANDTLPNFIKSYLYCTDDRSRRQERGNSL